jgi:hypothetical protein
MFKSLALTVLALTIALGGGAGSVWLALDRDFEFGTINVGSWTAFPSRGTRNADPYSKARFSREADLSLGNGEGIVFVAKRDTSGELLRTECDYRVRGELPPARFWTMHVRRPDGSVMTGMTGRASAIHSYALLRSSDSTATATVSRHAAPGNWLATADEGPFQLVLTFYDTAMASGARISEVDLPQIERATCNG